MPTEPPSSRRATLGAVIERMARKPAFDAMVPAQEHLAVEFCREIGGKRGEPGRPPDPVRLLEMAQALYDAEMKG